MNPKVHAYARGKGKHLTAAVELLQNFTEQVWTFETEQQTLRADEPPTPPQDEDWEVLDLRKYYIPNTENVWFSDADASVWFIPDSAGARSMCGECRAYQDDRAGVWWCNEIDKQLYFPAAA